MTLGITEHKINMEQTRGIYSELLQMSPGGRPKAGLGKSPLQDTCRSAWSLTSSRGLCVTPLQRDRFLPGPTHRKAQGWTHTRFVTHRHLTCKFLHTARQKRKNLVTEIFYFYFWAV